MELKGWEMFDEIKKAKEMGYQVERIHRKK